MNKSILALGLFLLKVTWKPSYQDMYLRNQMSEHYFCSPMPFCSISLTHASFSQYSLMLHITPPTPMQLNVDRYRTAYLNGLVNFRRQRLLTSSLFSDFDSAESVHSIHDSELDNY